MARAPDRKKLRREYLRKKVTAYLGAGVGAAFFVPALCAGAMFGIAAMLFLLVAAFQAFQGTGPAGPYLAAAQAMVICLLGTVVSCGVATASWFGIRKARMAARIEHVPAVVPDRLPADEILVRGASEPCAPSETLLRATVKGEEAKAEELLRVVPGTVETQ